MSKGKVAVIEICSKCPYKAFDNTMGLMINHDDKIMDEHCSEIAYCGWFKPLDNTKLRIEEYLNIGSHKFGQPDNCPLPDGNDGSKWRNVYGEDNSGKFPNSTDFNQDDWINAKDIKKTIPINECIQCGWQGTDEQKIDVPQSDGMGLLTCPKCGHGEFYLEPSTKEGIFSANTVKKICHDDDEQGCPSELSQKDCGTCPYFY